MRGPFEERLVPIVATKMEFRKKVLTKCAKCHATKSPLGPVGPLKDFEDFEDF